MDGLVLFELSEEGVEGFEVVRCRGRVEVQDCGEGEAEEEVVCRAAGELGGLEVRKFEEVGFAEEERVEPVNTPFVAMENVSFGQLAELRRGGGGDGRFAEVVEGGDAFGGSVEDGLVGGLRSQGA